MLVNGEQLQNYSLFGGLDPEVINSLLALIRKVEFHAGELIFAAGSDGDEVCFILEGEVSIVTDGLEVARLGEGEQFGEMHLIDIMPRSADVVGISHGSFLALHHRDMFRLRKIDPNAYVFLLMNCSRDISRRLRAMNRKYAELLKKDRFKGC